MKIKLPTMKKNNKNFLLLILSGVLLILLAIIFAPIWSKVEWAIWKNWGTICLNIIIGCFLLLYMIRVLLPKIRSGGKGVIKVLTILEFAMHALIVLYLILGVFNIFPKIVPVNGACAIFGLALWIRGMIEMFRAYYYKRDTSSTSYPLWFFALNLAFVSIGLFLLLKPIISDTVLLWALVATLVIIGGYVLVAGIYGKPAKASKSSSSASKPAAKSTTKSKTTSKSKK